MSLIKENEIYLKNVINDLEMNIDKISLEPSSRKEFGQFQINVAMHLVDLFEVIDKRFKKLENK